MITRRDLRRDGADLRKRLFGSEAGTDFVPNYEICATNWRSEWYGTAPASHCQIA
jgi:hypothetical protein